MPAFCNHCGTALASGADLAAGEGNLTGLTPLYEQLEPEEVREGMDRVFGKSTRIILGYSGAVEKCIAKRLQSHASRYGKLRTRPTATRRVNL